MNEERFYELISKYLAREISEAENNELSIILQVDQYRLQFEQIVDNWNNSSRDNVKFNTEIALSKISSILSTSEESAGLRKSSVTTNKILYKPFLIKFAASIAFIALLLTVYYYINRTSHLNPPDVEWQDLVTSAGEKYELILPDKSKIIVNGESKVRYPKRFTNNERKIYLEGEAFFEIAHDSSKPFKVFTNAIYTVVMGTKFNISAFPGDGKIEVSLVEGSVKVVNEKSGADNEAIMLKPMQKLEFDNNSNISTIENFDLQEKTGWKDNILKFNNTNLKDVLIKLERAFGIKFELSDKSFNNFKITGNFQKATYNTICEALKRLTKLQYKIIKENVEIKKIIFYNNNKK